MTNALAFAAGCALRATAVLLVAWVVTAIMRDQSAAKRHGVWLTGIVCALLVPFASALMPRVTVASVAAPQSTLARLVVAESRSRINQLTPTAPVTPVTASHHIVAAAGEQPPSTPRVLLFAALAWLAGFVAIASRSIASIVRMRRTLARARAIDDPRVSTFIDRLTAPAWSNRVRVVESAETQTPLSTCVRGHTIVLPASHADWSDRELQLVLAHETAHIMRYDCVTHLAGTVFMAIHWFNPVAWRAVRGLRAEAEQACDDRALRSAVEPLAYAELLLTFARSSSKVPLAAALPMADGGTELEHRLTAIVDETRRRESCSARRHVVGALCGAAVVMAVATPQLAATPIGSTPSERVPSVTPPENPAPTRPSSQRAPAPARTVADTGSDDERLPFDDEVMRAARAAAQTLHGPDSSFAALLFGALEHVPLHDGDLVKERAAWALTRARGSALVTPLIDALASRNWREAAYAAWALGASGDTRAVIPLLGALTNDAWRVRANAAGALQQIGDPRATDAMRAALGDAAWQVRTEAVQFLGRVGDTQSVQRMLKDPHIAVRSAAESALNPAGR